MADERRPAVAEWEKRVMHCRMCSQRLPRPGRLCRECELERELSHSAKTPDRLVAAGAGVDESLPLAGVAGWAERLPRSMVIVAALAAGLTVATAVYVLNGATAAGARHSVMIDRDLSAVRARASYRSSGGPSGDAAAARSAGMTAQRSAHEPDPPLATPVATTVSTPPVIAAQRTSHDERFTSVAPPAHVAYDRVLGLADALERCALQSPFARLACEQRARAHYCEGVDGRIPHCGDPPSRDQVQ